MEINLILDNRITRQGLWHSVGAQLMIVPILPLYQTLTFLPSFFSFHKGAKMAVFTVRVFSLL